MIWLSFISCFSCETTKKTRADDLSHNCVATFYLSVNNLTEKVKEEVDCSLAKSKLDGEMDSSSDKDSCYILSATKRRVGDNHVYANKKIKLEPDWEGNGN